MENPKIESNPLMEELQQPVYVADMDTHELLYMNRACRQMMHCDDYAGKRCHEVIQGLDAPCPFCPNGKLKKDEVYRWEHYNEKLGLTYQLHDNQIDYHGHRARIEIIFDVSDHVSREQELQNILETQRELAAAIQIINGSGTIDERLMGALENGGAHFQADRSYIFLINRQGSLDNVYEWCREGVAPKLKAMQGVDIRMIDPWMPAFKQNKAAITPDAEAIRDSRPVEYRIMKEQAVTSTVEVPLYNGDQLIGFTGLDNPSPEKIENAGELLIPLAYAIANAYTRWVGEQEQQEMFRQTIQSLFAANPESLCTVRVNLSRNSCHEPHGQSQFIRDALRAGTVDGMIEKAAAMIPIPVERRAFRHDLSRNKLLALYHQGRTDFALDYRRRTEGGRLIWVRIFVRMLRNPETGDIEGIVYSLNVTRDKYRDLAFSILTDREYDCEALLDTRDDTVRFLNLSTRLPVRYRKSFGRPDAVFPYGQVTGFAADTFVVAEDRSAYLENCRLDVIKGHLDEDGCYEYQVRGRDAGNPGEYLYRRLQYYYLDDTRDTILIVQSDVTAAVRRQKKENEYVEDIIDSVSTGIVSFRMPDADHLEGMFVNLQMFRILGMDRGRGPEARKKLMADPLIADYMKDAFTAVHPDDLERVKKVYHDGYDKEYFNAGNYRIIRGDGRPVWVSQEAIRREVRPDGHIFYASYRVAEREVALQAELEKQLETEKLLRDEADSANSAKSEFLSQMSHDMRTPLNGIIGMTYLTQEMALPEQARANLEKIDTSSKFLLSLINDVLDMAKAESGEIELHPEPYPVGALNQYLDAVIRPLCREKGQAFVLDEDLAVTEVVPVADKLRSNQIVFNLLSNAVKYTPEGGTVTYRIRNRLLASGKMQVEHEITDTGIGMSADFQKVLFQPFTQENQKYDTERRGTGLGLAIVKKLVDQMGGTITVNSVLGRGTTFRVRLRFDTAPAEAPGPAPGEGAPAADRMALLAGKHILLCEDHPLNQEIARAILERAHMVVTVADDGEAGVRTFAASAAGTFDGILMDIHMPVMDGYGATRAIRALDRPDARSVPIIAMTADAFTDDIRKCLQSGMDGHIAKPVDPGLMKEELLKAITKKS